MLRSAGKPVASPIGNASVDAKEPSRSRQEIREGIAVTERILDLLEGMRDKLRAVEPEQEALDQAIQNLHYAETTASPYAKEALNEAAELLKAKRDALGQGVASCCDQLKQVEALLAHR